MSRQPQETDTSGTFNTLLFAGLLVAGAIAGGAVASHVLPGVHPATVMGTLMLPLGVILGISFGQKSSPPTAMLNIFAVFEGRHTLDEVIARSGGSGGMGTIGAAIIVGCVVVSIATVGVIDFWIKPAATFGDMAQWFGAAGVLYGILSTVLIGFLTE